MAFKINVNGKSRNVDVEEGTPLLWALRDGLGILGPKFGCGVGHHRFTGHQPVTLHSGGHQENDQGQ